MFVFQIKMKSECQPLTFNSYIKYNDYKFFSRKSHDEFVTFITNYEQLKAEVEEEIYKTYSRGQLSVLDLLSASNLANEDVEQILNSKHETDAPEDLYKNVKKSVQEIAEALANLDCVDEDRSNDAIEDDISMYHDDVKEETRKMLNTIEKDEKPLVIKFTQSIESPQPSEKASDEMFNCDGCEKSFTNEKNLYIHKTKRACGKKREENHLNGKKCDPEKYMICPDCGKTVTVAYYLGCHKHYHLNEGLTEQCPECGKVVSKNAFRKHKDEHKRKQRGDIYHCDLCPFKANAKYKVNTHRKIQHGPKSHTCDLCGVMFKLKSTLENHILTKHRDPVNARTYQCEMCEFTSKCEVSLNTHIQFRHREGRCVCSFCDFETLDSTELSRHLRTEHDFGKDLTPKKSQNEKIYKCTQCKYSARSPQALRVHVKVKHVGIRFKCEKCDFTCTTKQQLRVHDSNKHLGVKYHCDFCPNIFSTTNSRRKHYVDKHPDQYIVYSCHLCSYRTDKKDLLQRHLSGKYGKHNS